MTLNDSDCPVCACAEIISGKWTLLVIRDLAEDNRRFCELERSLEGISPRTLSLRLRALEECGVVERHTYPEVPPRVEYALTEKGRALSPLIEDMRSYGQAVARRSRRDRSAPPKPSPPETSLLTRSRSDGIAKRKESCSQGAMPGRAKTGCVRDLHLRHTLKSLARDASEVLSDLVEGGQEIPYELSEPSDGFALCQYQPLTARFVRDNATELRELSSFREAADTMRKADVAGAYLEEAGIAPPNDSTERATLAVTYFLARLWDGSADFELDEDRFSSTIAEIEDCAEPEEGEVEAIVPLVGFQMTATRLELSGASIVRADAVDVPADAARGERPSGAAWEPTFLISARVSLDPDGSLGGAGERVARTFERVVTTLRLHKPGGVGLAPHGWVRVAGDRWRRIATGAGRPRPGGYRLTEQDLLELPDLARTVCVHPRRIARLRRALLSFEAGLDRRGAIDALNDHLLALRFLLEGEGPAGVGLPMRVAALTQDAGHRIDAKHVVEQAIALERELWSGEPARGEGAAGPSEVASHVEELLRTILRRGVIGELGSDFRAAADETLLADGLAFGDGAAEERGATTEWELEPVGSDLDDLVMPTTSATTFPTPTRFASPAAATSRSVEEVPPLAEFEEEEVELAPTRAFAFVDEIVEDEAPASAAPAPAESAAPPRGDWLEEVPGEATMDFPARSDNHLSELSRPPMDRTEVKARVEYLFPRTETNWSVGGRAPHRAEAAS